MPWGFDDRLVFTVANADGEHFRFKPEVLGFETPVLLHRDARPDWKWFSAERKVSILGVVRSLGLERTVIGCPYRQLWGRGVDEGITPGRARLRAAALMSDFPSRSIPISHLTRLSVTTAPSVAGRGRPFTVREALNPKVLIVASHTQPRVGRRHLVHGRADPSARDARVS